MTAEPIQLTEYEEWQGQLDDEDAAFILNILSSRFLYRREVLKRETVDILNPKQWVGVITLPSGRRLESRPKVPVRNLFYMLAVALDLKFRSITFWDELAEYEGLDDVLEFVASYYADLVDERIKHGLYRSYIEREENLGFVRGRIMFSEDVRRNYALRHRTYCSYSDFTWDIPENQIIRQVIHLLSNWGFRPKIKFRLSQTDNMLAEVTPTQLPSRVIDSFHYTRHNSDYHHIHQLCRLFLEGSSLHEDVGPFEFQTFLLDMNKLFEQFVTQLLINKAPSDTVVNPQLRMHLDTGKQVDMAPDIVISIKGVPSLIADCKYKRLQSLEYKNADMYQLTAYCTAAGVSRGILTYPLSESERGEDLHVMNSSIVITHTTLDLGKEGGDFSNECESFAESIFRICAAGL